MRTPAQELERAVLWGAAVRRGDGATAVGGEAWGPERELSAEALQAALVDSPRSGVARGAVLVGLRIVGRLNLEAVELQAPLIACGCWFEQPVNLTCAAAKEIQLVRCRLPGLVADELRTEGILELSRTTAKVVSLIGARIGGQLNLEQATLTGGDIPLPLGVGALCPPDDASNPEPGFALMADQATVEGGVFCRALRAQGVVSLRAARVVGEVQLREARLDGGLAADRLSVRGSMFCTHGFRARGGVGLLAAHIAGQLSLRGAKLDSLADELALDLERARVERDLVLRLAAQPAGGIDLRDARLGGIVDSELTWPSDVRLRGCSYGGLSTDGTGNSDDVALRLRWIGRAGDGGPPEDRFAPQPYTQLMALYRQEGRDGDARRVGYAREGRRTQALGRSGRAWKGFLRSTVGYGYKPLRALVPLAGLLLVGTLAFSQFHEEGKLPPIRPRHPQFDALIYTFDRLVPVVSFGLRDAFDPHDGAQWLAFLYTLAGWALTVAVLAGVNAALRRD